MLTSRIDHHHARLTSAACLGLAGMALALSPAAASAQWTVINLHPAGVTSSETRGVYEGQQVGVSDNSLGALLWQGSAPSVRRLNPLDGHTAVANSVFAGQQAGSVNVGSGINGRTHAAIWSGTPRSLVDLHPGADVAVHSMIAATDGLTQVGSFLGVDSGGATFATGRPCLWHGTAASFTDLTPLGITSGEVRGVSGNQQVGAHFDNGLGTACMWTGTADSFVLLQPDAALFSAAQCTDGVHQYGVIGILEPVPGLYPVQWSGTADSWELLEMPADHWGEVHAVHGGYPVGYITDTDGISNSRACVWNSGTAAGSYLDLQQFLPALYTESNALGVWRHTASGTTYIVGYALNSSTNQREGVMWVNGPGVNLITSPTAPADDSSTVGQPIVYSVRVANAGAAASNPTTLSITLPPAAIATYASATPAPTSVTATQLTFDLGTLAASGGVADVSITLTAVGGNTTATITATATSPLESDPTNNTASASTHIPAVPCAADFNNSGAISVQDIFDFLAAYFTNAPAADFNHSGAVSVQDIFDYLAAYFAGCP